MLAFKMAEEAGSEIVTVVCDHLNKVKNALSSRSNMDKTLKEEALLSVSEMNNLLNKLSGMFLGLENTLKKVITAADKGTPRTYSEQLATSVGPQNKFRPQLQSGDGQLTPASLILKPANSNMQPDDMKKLIKETVDPKALQLGISKMKKLSNNALLVECNNHTDRDILEKELNKLDSLSLEYPKKKQPTLLLKFVPWHIKDEDIKDIVIHQNNLTHLENPELITRFTKKHFQDSRHIVVQASPNLRKELIALQRIKINWSMCRVEDFIVVTRCFKCLGFGHTSKYCNNQQKCSHCAEEHHWKNCENRHNICCANCATANTYINNNNKKLNTNHDAFSKECPRLRRIESIIISKTEF